MSKRKIYGVNLEKAGVGRPPSIDEIGEMPTETQAWCVGVLVNWIIDNNGKPEKLVKELLENDPVGNQPAAMYVTNLWAESKKANHTETKQTPEQTQSDSEYVVPTGFYL